MKKTKIFALLLAMVTFIFAGCSFGWNNLKSQSTVLSPAQFYAKTYLGGNANSVDASQITVPEEDFMAYTSAGMAVSYFEDEILYIVSVMDFSIEIANNSENTENKKFYEYAQDEGYKHVVVVTKKTSSTFVAEGYLTSDSVTDVLEQEPYKSIEFKLTGVTQNINYTLTYKIDGKTYAAGFTFDADKGYMLISAENEVEGLLMQTKREIYLYSDNIFSIRTLTNSQVIGVYSTNYIMEILSKPYFVRSKLGEVSDTSLMPNLSKTSEEIIASSNDSDKWCYVIEADATEDALDWDLSYNKYGQIA